jgi:hypothetical protein
VADGEDIQPEIIARIKTDLLSLMATGATETEVRRIVEQLLNEARGE